MADMFTWQTSDAERYAAVLEFLADRDARLETAAKAWPTVEEAALAATRDIEAKAAAEVAELTNLLQGDPWEAAERERLLKVITEGEGGGQRDPFAGPPEFEQGLYRSKFSERTFLFVYRSQAGTHWLAKRVVRDGDSVEFVYEGAAGRFTEPGLRCTPDEHIAFGQAVSFCGFCSRSLSDGESQTLGYGPHCAAKHNLPHSGAGKG